MRKKCGMVEYLEVSAKTGDGIQAMFKAIINYEKLENKLKSHHRHLRQNQHLHN